MDQEARRQFAHRLRRFRQWRLLTKTDLARRARVSVTSLTAFEQAGRLPTARTLDKLAVALGVGVGDLLDHEAMDRGDWHHST